MTQMIRQAVFKRVAKKNCSMMLRWHHAVSGSVHPKVPEAIKNFVCPLIAGLTPLLPDYDIAIDRSGM